MRQHHIGLCQEDFLAWMPVQVQRFIEKYHMFTPQERVLVAVSGGKDSLSLWDILQQLHQVDGLQHGCIDGGWIIARVAAPDGAVRRPARLTSARAVLTCMARRSADSQAHPTRQE
jgi:hypothetical protein